jgi:hypothetical protein
VEAGELEQHGDGREPEDEGDAEARPRSRERGGDDRAAESMTARPRRVEGDEVHPVPIERRPGEGMTEHELDGHDRQPDRDPSGVPQLPRRSNDEQKRDGDLPGQGHDLSDRGAERVELRMEKRYDRLHERRRLRRTTRERHGVIDSPLVEVRQGP